MTSSPEDDMPTVVVPTGPIEPLQRSVASLMTVTGKDVGHQHLIRRKETTLGRTRNADIVLSDRRISRIHAKIITQYDSHSRESAYSIVDMGSTNHVFVNGETIERYPLQNGDKIQVGDTILRFDLLDEIDSQFHADIQRKIRYDDLTGLLTYDSFKAALARELEESLETKRHLTVVMMDLDHFKLVNDNYGHQMGSYVINQVGQLIQTNLRRFDIGARYGGEEFVAFMPETTIKEAMNPIERLHAVIGMNKFEYGGEIARVTISMGVAEFPKHGITIEALVERSDKLLYKAKSEGRNRICVE